MNKRQCALYAKLQAFEAWQEVVEVIFSACPFDLFQPKMREDLLLRLLQEILDRVCLTTCNPQNILSQLNFKLVIASVITSVVKMVPCQKSRLLLQALF